MMERLGDFRFGATGNHDGANDEVMMDIGDRGRPPDLAGSWVSKVTGMHGGGMPVPEKVLDDDFVSARLRVEFPNEEDGEPEITIDNAVLEVMNGLWKQCMIVKVLGRNVTISALSRKLREIWKPKGAMYVMDLPRHFFMIRFEMEEEYLAAVTGGPWRAFGSYLTVQAWSPEFDPLRDEIVTTPVWVRLSNIPVNLYHKSILMGIARGLGKPIKVDATTLNFERERFARVCVEVNLSKPLKGTVVINGERYFVSYEGLSNICSNCGMYGHLVHSCPKVAPERATTTMQPSREQTPSGPVEVMEDGFTVVRRSGRRAERTSGRVGAATGGSGS